MVKQGFLKRKKRVRAKIFGTRQRPRMSVYRSNKGLYVQLIDDVKRITLLGVACKALAKEFIKAKSKQEVAFVLGEEVAKKALKQKIKTVVFDRSGYRYIGRIKALAEGARKGGLKF